MCVHMVGSVHCTRFGIFETWAPLPARCICCCGRDVAHFKFPSLPAPTPNSTTEFPLFSQPQPFVQTMPAAKKKPATKKKAAATKAAPTAASPAASPAGPDPVVVLGYQLGKSLFWRASPHLIVAGPWTAFCTFVLMPSKKLLFRIFLTHFISVLFCQQHFQSVRPPRSRRSKSTRTDCRPKCAVCRHS
jgi:hypothetical protein